MPTTYETVIGLEVHAQLLTRSKLFCRDSTEFGQAPNTAVSAISLGHPGTLPRLNKDAVALAIKLGLATNCQVVKENYFARKNYFYPDLPKGYQISQHTTPICVGGFLEVEVSAPKKIRINRIHMEEDAGKSIHDGGNWSLIDYNRAGMPLVEIVTEPDISNAEEAAAYLTKLRKLVRALGVCDGNMEEGSFRCDVNISLRPVGSATLGTKVEIKNLNSVRFMKKAIEHEVHWISKELDAGHSIQQQTKGFDEKTGTTYTIRVKENEDDYRYFPEPDLPPFFIEEKWIAAIRSTLPADSDSLASELEAAYGISRQDAALIADEPFWIQYFKEVFSGSNNAKAAANWITGPLRTWCMEQDIAPEMLAIPPAAIATLVCQIDEGVISYGIATQHIFPALTANPGLDIVAYINAHSLRLQQGDESLALITEVLGRHPDKVAQYKKGKKGLMGVFVGEVMKLSKGKADAKKVTEILKEKLEG